MNQLFVYADDVDLIGDDIDALQSNSEVLVEACDEIGLQVNVEKTKYMITSRNTENEGYRYITIKNENIEKVNKFKYLGAYVKRKNEVTEETKRRLVSGNPLLLRQKTPNLAINIKKAETENIQICYFASNTLRLRKLEYDPSR